MATRTVKARVELDGEKEYKQALSELNAGNRTLGSEMRKLQAEYKGNTESVEFLTKKGELLERQLLQQKDKVETLRKAVQDSAEKFGESDKRTQEWIKDLNNAEAAEFDLQHAIEDNNKALSGETDKMAILTDTADQLAEKLGIKIPGGAKNALESMKDFSSGTVLVMSAAAAAIVAVVAAVKQLHELTKEVAADMDELATKSLVSNLSTDLLQQLQYAAPLIDVEVETITGSMTKLTKNMAEAAEGNEGMKQSFEDLGIEIQNADGSLRSSEEVFFEIVDALGQIGNDTERDALAMSLLGKSAQELNPLIKQGTDALQEYMDAANENYVLTEDQIQALTDLDDQVESNRLQWEGLQKQLAAQFAPASTEVLKTFGELVGNAGEALINSGIIEGVGEILKMLTAMFQPLADLLETSDTAEGRLRPVYEILHAIAGVLAWIADAAQVVVGLLDAVTGHPIRGATTVGTALGFGASSGNYSNLQKWQGMGTVYEGNALNSSGQYTGNYYAEQGEINPETYYEGVFTGNIYDRNATGNDNWRGGLTWVGEAGPELVSLPGGSQILNAQDSRYAGGDTFYITIDAKNVREFNDIVEMCRNAEMERRMK